MFAPNLRRKIFGWLERLKNSAGIRLSHKKIRRRRGAFLKIRRGGWRLRGLLQPPTEGRFASDARPQRRWDCRRGTLDSL